MIYPRLKLAKNLLRNDGTIFISIDDAEYSNLKRLVDNIFGEANFIASIVWSRKRGKDNSAKFLSRNHEYLLTYAKDINIAKFGRLEMPENTRKAYKNQDNDDRGDYRLQGIWARGSQGGSRYSFKSKDGQFFEERLWLVGYKTMNKLDSDDRLVFKGDNIYKKLYLSEYKGDITETIWDDTSNAANAADEIKELFGYQVFDTVKPLPYIERMLKLGCPNEGIVLDFFAGSGTTGHAVMKLNTEQQQKRTFINIQLPESVNEKSLAYRNGFKTVSNITKERLKLASDKLKTGGFKVFKLDESNIRPWDADFDNLEQILQQTTESIKPERSREDVLYEILLKYGIELTVPVETKLVNNKQIFIIGAGALIVSLDDEITGEVVEGIAKLKIALNPETTQVVFKDAGFADSNVKTNAIQILRQAGIDDVKSI